MPQTTVWLGAHAFDVTDRSIVVHKLRWVEEPVAANADAIEVDAMAGIDEIGRLAARSRRPVVVTCHGDCGPPADVHGFDRLAMAGVSAVVLAPQPASDLDALAEGVAEAGVSVIVDAHGHDWGATRAQEFVVAATAKGIDRDHLVVDLLGPIAAADDAAIGRVATALIEGGRLVRTVDVRAARRIAHVVDELRRGREASGAARG